jgi:hypothetical protein
MRRRRDTPRTDGGPRRQREREPAAEALERRYRRLLTWYPAAYRAANADDMLGVALARSASGRRWPEPGEAVNLIVSGAGERLAGVLRRPDHRDTAAAHPEGGEAGSRCYSVLTTNLRYPWPPLMCWSAVR